MVGLADHYFRLHWYLLPFRDQIEEIVIPTHLEVSEPLRRPDYLDPYLEDLDGSLPVRFSDGTGLTRLVDESDHVFVWSSAALSYLALSAVVAERRVTKIDGNAERYAGSFYLKFAEHFEAMQRESTAKSERVFAQLAETHGSDVGYLFGTGPSLSASADTSF